jgi:site-specific DNA recombinase
MTSTTMNLRCAIYARYSSDQQSPLSIIDQVRKCSEFANQQGWLVLEPHVYKDEEMSGVGSDRPSLQRLLEVATTVPRPFDVVLVDDTSRLSRRQTDMLGIFERLPFAGVRIVAVSQGIDSDSEQADVLVTVHGLVDSLYVKELAKKTHRGLEGCALRGLHTGGRCYGYRSESQSGGVRLVVDEAEATVVRRIFKMCADGLSLKTIAKTLNAEGVASPRPRAGRRYATWCPSAIREMIRRERYIGRIVWNRSRFVKRPGTNKRISRPRPRGEWRVLERSELQIVSDDLWSQVQGRLAHVKEVFGRGNRTGLLDRSASSPYLLTGFLKCGLCGANLVIVTGRGKGGHPRYGCPQNFYRGACDNKLKQRQDLLETSLLAGLQQTVLRPEVIDYAVAEFDRQLRAALSGVSSDMAKARARKQELEMELLRLTDAIAQTGPSRFLIDAIAERERRLTEIRDSLPTGPGAAQAQPKNMRAFVTEQIQDLSALLYVNPEKARLELSKHTREVRMVPDYTNGEPHYVATGEWNLLGGYEKRVRMVAGDGFEPPTFGL